MEYPAFLHRALYEQRGTREICICYRSVSGVSDTGLPGQIGTVGTGRFAEFHDLFGWSDFISKLFPIMEAPKSMTCYFDLGMRNKVLSVLLAAGMVASMPAATAFNVMADTTDDTVVGNVIQSDHYTLTKYEVEQDDPATKDVDETGNSVTLYLKGKTVGNVTYEDATINVPKTGDPTIHYADGKTYVDSSSDRAANPSKMSYVVTPVKSSNCTEDGTSSINVQVKFDTNDAEDDADKSDKLYDWVINDTVNVKASGHVYEYLNGTWKWTKGTGTLENGAPVWNATYTYWCQNDPTHTVTVPATVDTESNKAATCAKDGEEKYYASVELTIDGVTKTYYFNGKPAVGTTTVGKDATSYTYGIQKTTKTEKGVTSSYDVMGNKLDKAVTGDMIDTVDENESNYFSAPIPQYNHKWDYDNAAWTWNARKTSKTGAYTYIDGKTDNYLAVSAKKETWDDADHYYYGDAGKNLLEGKKRDSEALVDSDVDAEYATEYEKTAQATLGDKTGDSTFVVGKSVYNTNKTKWDKLVYVKLTCLNNNTVHYSAELSTSDQPKTVYVPAFVVADVYDATCEEDAHVTYTAYVFYNEASAKAMDKKLGITDTDVNSAVSFYNAYQIGSDGKSYADAYGKDFTTTKTDTWENSAIGHDYRVANWTWGDNFRNVSLNLYCTRCGKTITKQEYATVNADGKTASVTVSAPNMRKNPTEYKWYGDADATKHTGWYADKSVNDYSFEFDLSAFTLKNSNNSSTNGRTEMTRLFNTVSGEHLFTADPVEIKTLVATGNWKNEGVAWTAPTISNTPVYRVYNTSTGEHVYTKNTVEMNTLLKNAVWSYEGIAWYSDDAKGVAIYRAFNPNAKTSVGSHHYTADAHEIDVLTKQNGWNNEGIAWYGLK